MALTRDNEGAAATGRALQKMKAESVISDYMRAGERGKLGASAPGSAATARTGAITAERHLPKGLHACRPSRFGRLQGIYDPRIYEIRKPKCIRGRICAQREERSPAAALPREGCPAVGDVTFLCVSPRRERSPSTPSAERAEVLHQAAYSFVFSNGVQSRVWHRCPARVTPAGPSGTDAASRAQSSPRAVPRALRPFPS